MYFNSIGFNYAWENIYKGNFEEFSKQPPTAGELTYGSEPQFMDEVFASKPHHDLPELTVSIDESQFKGDDFFQFAEEEVEGPYPSIEEMFYKSLSETDRVDAFSFSEKSEEVEVNSLKTEKENSIEAVAEEPELENEKSPVSEVFSENEGPSAADERQIGALALISAEPEAISLLNQVKINDAIVMLPKPEKVEVVKARIIEKPRQRVTRSIIAESQLKPTVIKKGIKRKIDSDSDWEESDLGKRVSSVSAECSTKQVVKKIKTKKPDNFRWTREQKKYVCKKVALNLHRFKAISKEIAEEFRPTIPHVTSSAIRSLYYRESYRF